MGMNITIQIPEETLFITKLHFKEVLKEIMLEVKGESSKDDIMTIQETAEYLKVSIPTIRSMIERNEIPFFKRGQVIRLNRWDVNEWMRKT